MKQLIDPSEVYVINLARDKERWNKVSQECARVGIIPKRVEAIYGKDLTEQQVKEVTTKSCFENCTRSMIGCWLSHLSVWRKMVSQGIQQALILEDDSSFVDDLGPKLAVVEQELSSLDDTPDLIFVGHTMSCEGGDCTFFARMARFFATVSRTNGGEYTKVTEHLFRPSYIYGCIGYVVTLQGARKLIDLLPLADGHVDMEISRKIGSLDVLGVTPQLVISRSTSSSSTQNFSFPSNANTLLDRAFEQNGTGLGFMLSQPSGQVKNYAINGWTGIFFLIGISIMLATYSSHSSHSSGRLKVIIATLLTVWLGSEYLTTPNQSTRVQLAGSIAMIGLGYGAAVAVKKLAHSCDLIED